MCSEMRPFENEFPEWDFNPSDSESGLWPQFREPCMGVAIPHSPTNHRVLPLAGLIYMCDSKTKKYILKRRFICMPARRRWVNAARVRPGAKLFIFDFEARLMWGIYEVTTFPHFLRGNCDYPECDLPYQIYFQLYQPWEPLGENVFKRAIEDNYFAPYKFHFELSEYQVATLMQLFRFQGNHQWMRTHHRTLPRANGTGRFHKLHNLVDEFPAAEAIQSPRSGIRRGTYKNQSKKHKKPVKLKDVRQGKVTGKLKVHSTKASVTPPIPEKKNDELLQCDLKLGRSEDFLRDSSPACFQIFLEENKQQDHGDSLTDSPISLEDGEFVSPKSIEYFSKNRQYRTLECEETASKERDGDHDCDVQLIHTRNFIEILEQNMAKASSSNTIHPDDVITVANNDDEAKCLPQPINVIKNDEIHIERDGEVGIRVQSLPTNTLRKHTRISPDSVPSADGGNKVKQSVWLRLSDPRPIQKDHLFSDKDASESMEMQQHEDFQSPIAMMRYGIWIKEQQPFLPSCSIGIEEGEYCYSDYMAGSQEEMKEMYAVNLEGRRDNCTKNYLLKQLAEQF